MIDVLLIADFPLKRTGIVSTAEGIFSNYDIDSFDIYCDQSIVFANKHAKELRYFVPNTNEIVIFSHIECKGLHNLLKMVPDALTHVGDWPGTFWKSRFRYSRNLKALFGLIRFYYRVRCLPKSTRFLFVNEVDTQCAIEYGFNQSKTLEIGVTIPQSERAEFFDAKHLCFTGNFRYAPNRDAAQMLIQWAKSYPQYHLSLVGYNAYDFYDIVSGNVRLYDSVPNIVDFLTEKRPVYVSLLGFGAGSKNKILEAMVSGCPIIATSQSLDSLTQFFDSVFDIKNVAAVSDYLKSINNNYDHLNSYSIELANSIEHDRSWSNISKKFASFYDKSK